MRNRHRLFSILVSVVFLLLGTIAFYFIYNHFDNMKINKASSLVKKVNVHGNQSKEEYTSLKTIIHNNQKRVVQIIVHKKNEDILGSGFLYNDKGDIITNAHVVEGAKTVTVKTSDARILEGTVIGIGDTLDIALVRVPELTGETPIKINRTEMAEVGDPVIALGSPLGLQNTVTTGIISGTSRTFALDPYIYNNVYQISAPITHGNSGGPLLNEETGEAIAINSAGVEESTIGFSIPLINVIEKLEAWSKNPEEITGIDGATSAEEARAESNGLSLREDAEYVVNYFYESLAAHDYVAAYALLGSNWQKSVPYEEFRAGYIHTLNVSVNQISSTLDKKETQATVLATIEAREQQVDGETITSHYALTYTVGYENDQLKILKGSGEKIVPDPPKDDKDKASGNNKDSAE